MSSSGGEIITFHVGQCGNQLARSYWEGLLRDCSKYNYIKRKSCKSLSSPIPVYDATGSAMFQSVDQYERKLTLDTPQLSLRARAILIDMEYSVINQTLRSPIGNLFQRDECILTDKSGSGNNLAHGFFEYDQIHEEVILNLTRNQLEFCDNPNAFQIMHSLTGGTGSGLGSKITEILSDNFPKIHRSTISMMPDYELSDDVVVSPYNTILALNKLVQNADAVFPFCNSQISSSPYNNHNYNDGKSNLGKFKATRKSSKIQRLDNFQVNE